MKKLDALLEKEGIERDDNLDYTIGLYDDDYNLAAQQAPALPTPSDAWPWIPVIRGKVF